MRCEPCGVGGTPAPCSGVTDPEKLPTQTAAPSLELRGPSEAELITGAAEGRSSLSAWAQGQAAEGTHPTCRDGTPSAGGRPGPGWCR